MHIARPFNALSNDGLVQATLSGCPPMVVFENAAKLSFISFGSFNSQTICALEGHIFPSIEIVILASEFTALLDPVARQQFRSTIERLLGLGYRVVVVSPPPSNGQILRCIKLQARDALPNFSKCDFAVSEISQGEQTVFALLEHSIQGLAVTYIDLRQIICGSGTCKVFVGGDILYRDDGHLSILSANFVLDWLEANRAGY